MNYVCDKINLNNSRQIGEVKSFLKNGFDIEYTSDVDLTICIRDEEDNIIATASRDKYVFKYFGICSKYQGENLSSKLVDELINDSFSKGIFHYFVFTKPKNNDIFKSIGFNELLTNELVSLLEMGNLNIKSYLDNLKKEYNLNNTIENSKVGAIVMNLNPITLGHRYLIEYASKEVEQLLIFLVEEDSSAFKFKDRFNMAKEACKDLENVKIIPSGPYLISRATFPTYFLKSKDVMLEAYTQLDAGIFGKYYAKHLNIKKRFLGEEPFDLVTNTYNETLKRTLKTYNVKLEIVKRKEMDKEVISASKVRRLLSEDRIEEAFELVPEATKRFLKTIAGQETIENLRENKTIKTDNK